MIPTSIVGDNELNRLKIEGNRFLKEYPHYYDSYHLNLSFKTILNKLIEYNSNNDEFKSRSGLEYKLIQELKFDGCVFNGDVHNFLDLYNYKNYIFNFRRLSNYGSQRINDDIIKLKDFELEDFLYLINNDVDYNIIIRRKKLKTLSKL